MGDPKRYICVLTKYQNVQLHKWERNPCSTEVKVTPHRINSLHWEIQYIRLCGNYFGQSFRKLAISSPWPSGANQTSPSLMYLFHTGPPIGVGLAATGDLEWTMYIWI